MINPGIYQHDSLEEYAKKVEDGSATLEDVKNLEDSAEDIPQDVIVRGRMDDLLQGLVLMMNIVSEYKSKKRECFSYMYPSDLELISKNITICSFLLKNIQEQFKDIDRIFRKLEEIS